MEMSVVDPFFAFSLADAATPISNWAVADASPSLCGERMIGSLPLTLAFPWKRDDRPS
jgi:hypothetical protein